MQHSPQEIKTILDRVVDPDGNVLDMAAVLEVVTILERLPITKEALEKTRLGKTINLLRKKTTNEDLARRAKGLVKKWQKLVINHLGTLRNTDSPINGSRVSSPQINGAIRVTENQGTPSERSDKSRLLEGKKRGAKRKRDSCSSSENSPVVFLSNSQPGTPNTGDGACVSSQVESTPLSPEFQKSGQDSISATWSQTDTSKTNTDCSPDSGIESQKDSGSLVQGKLSQISVTESETNDPLPDNTANELTVSLNCSANGEDTRWTPSLNTDKPCESPGLALSIASAPSDGDGSDNKITEQVPINQELLCSPKPKELMLDMDTQAEGVTGRYGNDGTWYDWTEVMPSSDGTLHILPYVILE